MTSILIAGCGYVGLALSRALSQDGWTVWGLRRDPAAASQLEAAGARALIADLTKPKTLAALPPVDYVVAAQAPGHRPERYRGTYLDGTRHLLAALSARPPRRFVGISSTRVYGQSQGEWVDETSPTVPADDEGRVLLAMESEILAAPFPTMVLRLAGIYGPGRDPLRRVREGRASAYGPEYLNHIHVEDVVGIIRLLLERGRPGEIYLGADNEPVARSQFYAWWADRAGERLPPPEADHRPTLGSHPAIGPRPPAVGPMVEQEHAGGRDFAPVGAREGPRALLGGLNKRCRNAKITSLGYAWRYPTYREGSRTVLAQGAHDDRSR